MKEDDVFKVRYPFKRVKFCGMDEEGSFEAASWAPGTFNEQVDIDEIACYAHGEGLMILRVVKICELPARYPNRVFFVRLWRDPGGKYFGSTALRVATVGKFKRLCAGYWHHYEVKAGIEEDRP